MSIPYSPKKAVIILSGGIDSSTLLFKLKKENYDLSSLTMYYGQKHNKELEYAKKIAKLANVPHNVIDISSLGNILNSALTNPTISIPHVSQSGSFSEALKETVVPFRNAILLSIAVGYAQSIGASSVFYAAHYSDRGLYPDCKTEFVSAFEQAARLGTEQNKLSVQAPFVNQKKSQIVLIGYKLNVPFHLTWSCYAGGQYHCGRCSSCVERKLAFRESGIYDPTIYINR